jgi:predicted PurR-regulated permease PerM
MASDDDVRAAPAATIAPPQTPSASGLSTLGVGVVVVAALYLGREVFVPLVLATLLSFVLAPLANLFRRLRIGRVASVAATVLIAIAIIFGIGAVIGTQLASRTGSLPQYQSTIQQKVSGLQQGIVGPATTLLQRVSHGLAAANDPPASAPSPQAATEDAQRPMLVRIQEPDPTPAELARNILSPIVEPLTTIGIVLVVVVFLLLQREDLRDRLIRLVGANDLQRTTLALDDAADRLSTYFLAQLALNTCFGVVIGLGLWAIGVPNPILWGVFSAVMRFVPYVGAFISGFFPVALAAAVDPGWTMPLLTAGLFLVAEPVTGQVIEPLLYGHSTGLSPVAVIVSAIFWGFLWGPIGLILATPFTVCLVVLGRHVERLEFLDVMLGDRPPLTPVENFYQRMLAGDPDEAQEQAEQMLKQRSLSSYYDEVALKALQMAASDFQRGALAPDRLETIKTLTQSLIQDLGDRPDAEPSAEAAPSDPQSLSLSEQNLPTNEAVPGQAPEPSARPAGWGGEAPVLCIAGRGALD